MADIATALRTRLLAHTGTAALIGTRAWYLLLPDNPTLPALTLQQIDAVRTPCMGADSAKVVGRVQVDVWALTRATGKALEDQVRAALQRWGGVSGGTTVDQVFIESETEEYEPGVTTWRTRFDFRCWWSE